MNKAKSIGVIIDEKLHWEEQFRRTKSKMKNVISQSQLCNVHYTLNESYLRYADVVWRSLSKTKIAALQCLQDRACLIISNAGIEDSLSTSWLNIEIFSCMIGML